MNKGDDLTSLKEALMSNTGIIREVDDLGRFVIPKDMRDTRDIKAVPS